MKKCGVFPLLFVLFTIPLFGGSGKIEKKPRAIRDSYLVVLDDSLKPNVRAVAASLSARHGARVKSVWEDAVQGFAVEATEQAALAIAQDPRVLYVEEDQEVDYGHCWFTHVVNPSGGCPDGSVPWQLDRIDQRNLPLNLTYEHCTYNTGEGVRVYIIDSGVRNHRDFEDANGASRLAVGRNVALNNSDTDDCFGHGTYVASTAAGRFDGIAKSATIVPVKIAQDCTGKTSNQLLVDAVNWAKTDHVSGPAVANMSVYAAGSSTLLDSAAAALVSDGVVLIVAAGNNNGSACNLSPQRVASVMVVGASTKTDAKASFSNHGSCVSVFAPGVATGGAHHPAYGAFNCNPGWNGTSVAAPQVAGVAAIIYKERYWFTPAQIKQAIIDAATLGKLTGLPSGTPNRLLYSAEPSWCPWMSCDGPPPES